jgi:aminopeptidase N
MALSQNPYRLRDDVAPRHYEIEITPDLDQATFAGMTTIELDVREETSVVEFNILDLELDVITLSVADREIATTLSHDAEFERATLTLAEPLPVGSATLRIAYRGELNDKLVGFYRSTFVDKEGVTRTIATTQFESSDARRAFPAGTNPSLRPRTA